MLTKRHFIIITPNIIKDIEKIQIIPDKYKKCLESLFLSNDTPNLVVAGEIIKVLFPIYEFIFIPKENLYNPMTPEQCYLADPSRTFTFIPTTIS